MSQNGGGGGGGGSFLGIPVIGSMEITESKLMPKSLPAHQRYVK